MPAYRSRTSTHGRNMAGARGLWRATGMKEGDFGKPIIAVVNSFTQFVPGHVHLKDLGQLVAREIEKAGGVAKEFNTIAIDDGIAMGHDGMLYSLPSREIIADSVEYMANGHCVDGLVCISNCDKITPGMLMAALRLNIPAVFVSGGPMEAGKVNLHGKVQAVDLVDAMVAAADSRVSDQDVQLLERSACPTCGSCSGMFTANSMNCLTEALGLALPGNGTALATHADRRRLFVEAGHLIVDLAKRYYEQDDASVLPRSIATFQAFENAMTLDLAMGGSTNTVLHLLAAAHEAGVDFTMRDIDRLSRRVPVLCKVAPSVPDVHLEDVHRAGGIMAILGELRHAGLIDPLVGTVHSATLGDALDRWDVRRSRSEAVQSFYRAAPGGVPTTVVEVVPPVSLGDGRPISSTAIRRAVAGGDLERAEYGLGRRYALGGRVVRGASRGRNLGFPTINVALPNPRKLLPPQGVYAVRVQTPGGAHGGMLNLGPRPTFGDSAVSIEACASGARVSDGKAARTARSAATRQRVSPASQPRRASERAAMPLPEAMASSANSFGRQSGVSAPSAVNQKPPRSRSSKPSISAFATSCANARSSARKRDCIASSRASSRNAWSSR